MILPSTTGRRERMRSALGRRYGLSGRRTAARLSSTTRRTRDRATSRVPVAFELARSAAQGAARDRPGDSPARSAPIPGIAQVEGDQRLPERLPRSGGVPASSGWPRRAPRPSRAPGERAPRRRSSSTRRSIRTRPRTSATCATRRSATRSCASCASAATPVEVQNYIDDTGVQVADVVVGFRELERKDARRGPRSIADATRFDYYCWDLYARVTEWYEDDKTRLQVRADRAARHRARRQRGGRHRRVHRRPHRPLPPRDDGAAERRLRPADVGGRHPAAAVLGARVRDPEGERRRVPADRGPAGRLLGDDASRTRTRARAAEAADGRRRREDENREKVIVRSNGTVTYVGKDIAYQFWKFGLLGRDFHYRRVRSRRRRAAAVGHRRRTEPDAPAPTPRSAARARSTTSSTSGSRTCRSCSSRRCAALGHPEEAEHSIHFSYEMVALSHATARELGYDAVAPRTRRGRSSRCPDARGSASRPTTCSTSLTAEGRRRGGEAEPGAARPTSSRRIAEAIAVARGPLLHGQVLARQGHRLRHRRGAELRGRKRAVPAVCCRPRQQHLPEARGTAKGVGEAEFLSALPRRRRRRADGRRARARPVGARARGVAARRGRRTGRPDARVLGAGEVRVRPGADVQRVLPPVPDPQRGARRRPALARGGRRLLPDAADRARST